MKKLFYLLVLLPFCTYAQVGDKQMIKKGINIKEHVPKGIEVGIQAPKITATSISGKRIHSSEILNSEKQIVVIFYRGEWCPICNRYLSNLNDSLGYILDSGAEVLVVGPENAENAEKTKDKSKGNFILIPDTTMKIMQDFDVLFSVTKKYQGKIKTFLFTDIAENNNQEEAKLPVPATYIIGTDGKVKWRHFDYDYSKRASAQSIIDNLKN